MVKYFATLNNSKIILWCYLIWYLTTVFFHFDSSIRIWVNSLGISFVIGVALLLSVSASKDWFKHNQWQTFRLFLMPFCVSSFSSLIKGQGFILIFPPESFELLVSVGNCVLFVCVVCLFRVLNKG